MTIDRWCPVKAGEVWRLRYQSDNPNNRTLHVRAVVDDAVVVCRVFSRRRGWLHVMESAAFLRNAIERGELKRVRKAK